MPEEEYQLACKKIFAAVAAKKAADQARAAIDEEPAADAAPEGAEF